MRKTVIAVLFWKGNDSMKYGWIKPHLCKNIINNFFLEPLLFFIQTMRSLSKVSNDPQTLKSWIFRFRFLSLFHSLIYTVTYWFERGRRPIYWNSRHHHRLISCSCIKCTRILAQTHQYAHTRPRYARIHAKPKRIPHILPLASSLRSDVES